MKKRYSQTAAWEHDCIKTRRSLGLRKRRLVKFDFKVNDKILELGCGDGLNIKILRKLGFRNIVGVDISNFLIKKAKKNNPEIKFHLASAYKLPFKDNTFDAVLVDSVFHHLIDYQRALKEIKRVLKKGGILCFSDPHKSWLRAMFDFLTLFPPCTMIPFFRLRKDAYLAEIDLMKHWLATEEIFIKSLEKVGFKKDFLFYDILSGVGQYKKI